MLEKPGTSRRGTQPAAPVTRQASLRTRADAVRQRSRRPLPASQGRSALAVRRPAPQRQPTGGYDQIDREHRKVLGWEGCGYHFVIGNGTGSPDGKIEVARRWSNQKNGVHCRNGKNPDVNEYGIGICLVGDLDDSPPTPRQVAAARALVAYLGDRYRIPAPNVDVYARLAQNSNTQRSRGAQADHCLPREGHRGQAGDGDGAAARRRGGGRGDPPHARRQRLRRGGDPPRP